MDTTKDEIMKLRKEIESLKIEIKKINDQMPKLKAEIIKEVEKDMANKTRMACLR